MTSPLNHLVLAHEVQYNSDSLELPTVHGYCYEPATYHYLCCTVEGEYAGFVTFNQALCWWMVLGRCLSGVYSYQSVRVGCKINFQC